MNVELKVLRLPNSAGLPLPVYASKGAAGMDIAAALDEGETLLIRPGERLLVNTGFTIEIPAGFEAQLRPRSGLALKNGITLLNSPGTIDSDYRGEVKVLLVNLGTENFVITRGLRIAQMVVAPVTQVRISEVASTGDTARGAGGFGSTGLV